jgi:hypothetical protein
MPSFVPAGRIVGLDVARCLALVGMIATHTLPAVRGGEVTLVQQVAGGRSSALFAVLAGASLSLMSGRTAPVTGQRRVAVSAALAVRALLIALVGLLLGELDSGIAVILTYYGLLFLLGIPFLGLRARALAVLSGVWLVVAPVLCQLIRPELPPRSYDSPSLASFAEPLHLLSELAFTGYYPVVPWLAYLLAGMAVGRLDLSRWRAVAAVLLTGLVAAGVSWWLSSALLAGPGVLGTLRRTYDGVDLGIGLQQTLQHGLYGTTPTGSWWWLAVVAPHSATPFDLAHTIGSALVVVAACVVLGRLLPSLSAVVFGAGAMTLTLYTVHVCLRTPGLWHDDGLTTFLAHVGLVIVLGAAFRLGGQRGPLEATVGLFSDGTKAALGGGRIRRSQARREWRWRKPARRSPARTGSPRRARGGASGPPRSRARSRSPRSRASSRSGCPRGSAPRPGPRPRAGPGWPRRRRTRPRRSSARW